MTYDITIHDADRGIDYELIVAGRVGTDLGVGDGRLYPEVDHVIIQNIVVWWGKCGHEVTVDPQHRRDTEWELQHKYVEEIAEAMCKQHMEAMFA